MGTVRVIDRLVLNETDKPWIVQVGEETQEHQRHKQTRGFVRIPKPSRPTTGAVTLVATIFGIVSIT
jgi:hypothetical protein